MTLQPLNYCRQMVRQLREVRDVPGHPHRDRLLHLIDLSSASQKFMLPRGGRLLDDDDLRGLADSDLRLPFPFVALEFEAAEHFNEEAPFQCTKRIVFAREDEGVVRCTSVVFANATGMWTALPDFGLAMDDWRGDTGPAGPAGPAMKILRTNDRLPASDYRDEAAALLSLLNALSCSNVRTEQHIPKTRAKVKEALPFDSYHYLTIEMSAGGSAQGISGSHRSPREHLRRGHVRRLPDDRRIWINATVVAAGRGSGVVRKDYLVRGAKK
ncbi:MAG: hypothetical protein PVS3B2_00540 [Candidatus Dormibacteraceae bacterium]